MAQQHDHVLQGTRPLQEPNPFNADQDDHFDAGRMEHFMVRNGGEELDAEELRRRHSESMTRKANAICCKNFSLPLVRSYNITNYLTILKLIGHFVKLWGSELFQPTQIPSKNILRRCYEIRVTTGVGSKHLFAANGNRCLGSSYGLNGRVV